MTVCKGCGIPLQHTDAKAPGYAPKEDAVYCQRCFRLRNYDDVMYSMKTGIDKDAIMDAIANIEGHLIWVVDLFDFEAGMIPGISRKLPGRDLLLVLTKRDVLPNDASHEKIAQFVKERLLEYGANVTKMFFTSSKSKEGIDVLQETLQTYPKGSRFIFMGRANSGKSTLVNQLLNLDTLTTSRYPGTTLDFLEMEGDGYFYLDTPGIETEHSMLMNVAENDLKTILPNREVKPYIYQLEGDQSFALGGLVRIDFYGCNKATVVFYQSEGVPIHRGKIENADELWDNHYGELLQPTPLEHSFTTRIISFEGGKNDIVVDGLGWCCVSGKTKQIRVDTPKGVNVTFRKAVL